MKIFSFPVERRDVTVWNESSVQRVNSIQVEKCDWREKRKESWAVEGIRQAKGTNL